MEAEGGLLRSSHFTRTYTEVTSPSTEEKDFLRKRNEELEKDNEDLKRRLEGTRVLAYMLGESEEKAKQLKRKVDELTASSTSSIANGAVQLPLQRPDHLQLSPSSYLTGDISSQPSQKTQNHRIASSKQSSNQGSNMSKVGGLHSQVVSDSSPSDVDVEEQQQHSNLEGNTSVHSQHESSHSKSPDISPLQSIHSEEFRSGTQNHDRSSQDRTEPTTPGAAGGRSPAQTPDHQADSFPSLAVRNLETAINDLAGNEEKSTVTPLLMQTITQVMKLERDNNTKTVLARNLMLENAELKTKLNRLKEEYEEVLERQREEIAVLKSNVRRLYEEKEREKYEVVEKAQVEKAMKVTPSTRKESKEEELTVSAGANSLVNIDKLLKKISDLEKQNKEILQVNQQWDTHYKGMKAAMETHINDLQRQLQEKDNENTRLRSSHSSSFDEQKQRDVDRMLIDSRKRVEVEESAKESVMHDLHLEKQRSETLNNRVGVLERQVTQLLQLKTGMENEIKRLNKALAETPPQPRTSQPDQLPIRTTEDMRSHIEALQAQVTIYKEDFETERRDRERIASEVDKLKTDKETLQAERDTFAQQARWYEEDFRREHEDRERLQRMLARRAVDDDYQFNVPPPARPVEKKAYPPRPHDYYHYGQPDQYMGAHQVPQPPPYYRHEPQDQQPQYRYNEAQQGRLIRRGAAKEDLPHQYPKYGQNLARNDLEVDAVEDVDGEAAIADVGILHVQSLKCPRCERDFQEEEKLLQHIERCVS